MTSCLAFDARRRIARLQRSVVVQRGAVDDGIDLIAVGMSLLESFQDDNADPGARDSPWALASNARQWPSGEKIAFLMVIACNLRRHYRYAARERDIALVT